MPSDKASLLNELERGTWGGEVQMMDGEKGGSFGARSLEEKPGGC